MGCHHPGDEIFWVLPEVVVVHAGELKDRSTYLPHEGWSRDVQRLSVVDDSNLTLLPEFSEA